MPGPLAGQRRGDVALGVPGRGQHQRHRDQVRRGGAPLRRRQVGDGLAQRRRGQLDEAARHPHAVGGGQLADPLGQRGEGGDPGLVAGAVRGEQQGRGGAAVGAGLMTASPVLGALASPATRSKALNAATATAEPPFSEMLLSAGRPLARRLVLSVRRADEPHRDADDQGGLDLPAA